MQLSPWLSGLFQAIDRQDAAGFAGYLADDARFVFGNAPAVCGKAQIEAAVGGFFGAIAGLSHELEAAWEMGETVICRGNVTYTRHDGSRLTVPFANILGLENGKVRDYLIYADTSPLFAPAAA